MVYFNLRWSTDDKISSDHTHIYVILLIEHVCGAKFTDKKVHIVHIAKKVGRR